MTAETRYKQQLPKSLERYADRIADWNDLRKTEEKPIFIGYAQGWKSGNAAAHYDAARNVREALILVRQTERCECEECKQNNA